MLAVRLSFKMFKRTLSTLKNNADDHTQTVKRARLI